MSITLELSPELEHRLRSEADRQGRPVESLLQNWIEKRSELPAPEVPEFYKTATPEEWIAEFHRWATNLPQRETPLPEEALRRENMYEDRW